MAVRPVALNISGFFASISIRMRPSPSFGTGRASGTWIADMIALLLVLADALPRILRLGNAVPVIKSVPFTA